MVERILVVDDEPMIRRALERGLTDLGFTVVTADSLATAGAWLCEGPIAAAFVDLMLGEENGLDVVRLLRERDPDCAAIVMTGFGTIEGAVDAMRAGAFHFITKPFQMDDVARLLDAALEQGRLKRENQALRAALRQETPVGIIGKSPVMREVFSLVEKVAMTDSTVLLLGESGTGKELVARAIHEQSERRAAPMITVNCAAIPDELLEAELFGFVRGAFTGAVMTRMGKFEAAQGGTIFLDEIAEMTPRLQVKLLRVLQERRVDPVGANQSTEVDVRIIAATNRDLDRAVQERTFREDLYYRLNVIPVKLPPLRARTGDVAILAHHFLERFNQENQCAVEGFAPEAIRSLEQYPWPGNVRELENIIERIVVLKGRGLVTLADLPAAIHGEEVPLQVPTLSIPVSGLSLKQAVQEFEQALIRQALDIAGGNKNRAATLLHLNRTTLVEKLKRQQRGEPCLSEPTS